MDTNFTTTPIKAWRVWHLRMVRYAGDYVPALAGHDAYIWTKCMTAVCPGGAPGHPVNAPWDGSEDCASCATSSTVPVGKPGIYAVKSPPVLVHTHIYCALDNAGNKYFGTVAGRVVLSGIVIEGPTGYRGQYAEIESLLMPAAKTNLRIIAEEIAQKLAVPLYSD